MDAFGRRFWCLVAGTTLGTVVGPMVVPDSTSLFAYTGG